MQVDVNVKGNLNFFRATKVEGEEGIYFGEEMDEERVIDLIFSFISVGYVLFGWLLYKLALYMVWFVKFFTRYLCLARESPV